MGHIKKDAKEKSDQRSRLMQYYFSNLNYKCGRYSWIRYTLATRTSPSFRLVLFSLLLTRKAKPKAFKLSTLE